ncbi:SAF domain-containing protein [Nisaea sp.]|uniref:NAD(P)H-dependent oxidoreductase n=1 Tax=Nisaea sp. TaxID=2024842 RepID=UPI0032EF4B36
MNYELRYKGAETVEVCLAGAGGFGRSLLAQSAAIPLLSVRLVVERDPEIAVAALRSLGYPENSIAVCRDSAEADAAWKSGATIVSDDLATVIDLPFSVLVEATGHPEAGARHARLAVERDRHVAVVSKEVDSVVGPGLALMARERGRVSTPVDGDQPSLLISLISWARILGLEILAAGKSSEYDFVFDPKTGRVTCNGVETAVPELAGTLDGDTTDLPTRVGARARALSMYNQRAVPDLCELSVVANATGLMPDRADLHAPVARIQEVPALFRPEAEGGLFSRKGVLDVFHCLRLPTELSLAGGVFVIVRCGDSETWTMLGEKGHILSPDGRTAMLATPRHLLGVEAVTTLLDAAILNETNGGAEPAHQVDLVAVATANLPAGTVLSMGGHHHTIENVAARMLPARALNDDAPAPFYLAANQTLTRTVPAGETIRMGDLKIAEGSDLLALRRWQDERFFGSNQNGVRE